MPDRLARGRKKAISVDKGLVAMFLKLSPEERLKSNDNAVRTILELRNAYRQQQSKNYGPERNPSMENSFTDFLNRNGNSDEACAIVEADNREIDLYERYKAYYGYGVYIAVKVDKPTPWQTISEKT